MHYLWLLLLLLLLCLRAPNVLVLAYKSQTSTNYELSENDSRYISYQDLMSSAKRFYDPDTSSYSELLFDVGRSQVIVGARDMLYRMSFDLVPVERSNWEATPAQIAMCTAKGQSERLCRNYVRVLQSYGENQLYACGTNAFSPKCTWRQMENLTVTADDSGVGKCPFNPHSNITSLMASNGKMFVGTATDFMGGDTAIIRTDVQPHVSDYNKIIRTKQYNSNWLSNPQFVGSFESGNFVYFLFRESAAEYMNCGKAVYSRIARVCKNDAGGDQFLKDNWTSFVKARLNCSLPGDYPYYFDEIQGMSYAEDEDVLYATFTTTGTSIFGSAVCAFNISAINAAFEGSFKHQEHSDSAWKSVSPAYRSQFQCESPPANDRYKHLLESSRYQLMEQAVQPITSQPLYYSNMERFKQIALNTLHTKTEKVHVLFVATNQNLIKKLSVKYDATSAAETQAQTCLVEVWQSDDTGMGQLLKMEYLKVTESLYVGTDLALTRIPAQHCSRHVSKPSCLNAMDPYCGWNELHERCTTQEMSAQFNNYWLQPTELSCPVLTAPIDGGWSSWSAWDTCKKHGEDDGDCMCRTRECNNPQPQNGGRSCKGITTEVNNCTVHGGWTEWSAWSACSQTCGIAVKTRRRTCGNPKPAYGGRTCVGSEHAEMYCRHLPPCPAPKQPSVDGGWGPWGEWSECSAQCGGGFRIRRRECNDPEPQNGGLDCPGCKIDYEDCNMHTCPEVKRLSAWTPWLMQYNESREGDDEATHVERRYRYACRATTADAGSVRISQAKEETRICRADGSCQRHAEHSSTTETESESSAIITAEWSPCNVSCGGGVQFRMHESKHRVRHMQSRACNMQPCEQDNNINEVVAAHEWSCWSEWSACTVSCGVGLKRRTRKCLGGHEKLCNGRAIDEEKCEMTPCEDFLGWSTWSDWSECSTDGIRFRHRTCLIESPAGNECRGSEFEKTACVPGECEGAQYASSGSLAGIILAVLLIYAITCFLVFWFTRKYYMRQYLAKVLDKNSTPPAAFETYPNQYSSLPTKDYYDVRPKVKRQASFNMCSPSKNNSNTGTLNRNNMNHNHTPKVLAKTYNDCEVGTLKRNSALNNYQRTNIDDEKF